MARAKRRDDRPIPDRPYRDSALVYGIMASVLVGLAALTGGSIVRACLAALTFFVLATAWSWWKFHRRIRERDEAAAAAAREGSQDGQANGDGSGGEVQ